MFMFAKRLLYSIIMIYWDIRNKKFWIYIKVYWRNTSDKIRIIHRKHEMKVVILDGFFFFVKWLIKITPS